MINNGHLKTSLVMVGHYIFARDLFWPLILIVTQMADEDVYFEWPIIIFKSLDMATEQSQQSLESMKWLLSNMQRKSDSNAD